MKITTNTHNNIPPWLLAPPASSNVPPPISGLKQLLPFGDLQWQNFERLCLRLASRDANPERCQLYGEAGEAQDGIDILVRLDSDRYVVWQAKRHKKFTASGIRTAVNAFITGKWKNKAIKFVLAAQASLRSTKISDEIERQNVRLREIGIEFVALGGDELSESLKHSPDLVAEFFGQEWVKQFCGIECPAQPESYKTSQIISRFCTWIHKTTCNYLIPGISVPIPVSKCWLKLKAFELEVDKLPPQSPGEALELYRKASESNSNRGKEYDAEWLGTGLRRAVLVGGPGAGKSLLLRRIASREAQNGRTVLIARLTLIAAGIYKRGLSFEESLLMVGTDGSGLIDTEKSIVARQVSLLLLDGLDECGVRRKAVAEALSRWSIAHPEVTVIVTTRSIGHNPGSLPGWTHFLIKTEDYHLFDFAIEGVCREVFKDQNDKIAEVETRLAPVFNAGWSGNDKGYRAIRDVPLLFSFMVSLAVNGCEIPSKRTDLFSAVIQLLAINEVQDRGVETEVDKSVADIFLNYLAWFLMENPICGFNAVLKKVGGLLAVEFGEKPSVAQRLAEQAFRYWEERRLIERLHHGPEELVAFLHLGFCEYAAAQFLCTLSPNELKNWVITTRNAPRWKEVYFNAATLGLGESLVEFLLELDTLPDSKEALFAADIAATTKITDEDMCRKLVQHILPLLTSAYSQWICNAGEALLPIAQQKPDLVGPYVQPLLSHEEEWTRFASFALCLQSGGDYINIQEVTKSYPNLFPHLRFHRSSPFGKTTFSDLREPYELRTAILISSTKMVLNDGVSEDVLGRIRAVFDDNISPEQSDKLTRIFREFGHPELLKIADDHHKKFMAELFLPRALEKHSETAFLDLALRTCFVVERHLSTHEDRPLIHLSKLALVLRIHNMSASSSWELWRAPKREAQALLVIQGAILAGDIEPTELALDIIAAKKKLDEEKTCYLFSLLLKFPMEADWSKCIDLCANNHVTLAFAVDHPCEEVSLAAAEMIFAGSGGKAVREKLKEVFAQGRPNTLFICSQLAEHVWGDDALDVIISRLEINQEYGCQHLLKTLPKLSAGAVDDRIINVVRGALSSLSPSVAQSAAELCLKYIPRHLLLPDLRHALHHWKEHEEPYPKSVGVIPPSPRSLLVEALIQREGLSIDELIELHRDDRRDVRDVATQTLLQLAKNDAEVVSQLLDLVEDATYGSATLKALLNLASEALWHERTRLLGFLKSKDVDVRLLMVSALRRHNFVSKEDSIIILREHLDDSDMDVREAARRALAAAAG